MLLKKRFKYRLEPSRIQEGLFARFAGAARWVFNRGLEERTELWKNEKRSVSLFDQNKCLTKVKQQAETAWLTEIHSQVLQQALHDLDRAFFHFFRRIAQKEAPGYPHFRCKGKKDSFRYPQGVRVEGDRVFLPKIGFVPFRKSREIEGEIKQTTVLKEGRHWYVSFCCEIEKEINQAVPRRVAGIDVGLETFATISTGQEIQSVANPRFLNRELKHVKYLSRQLSRKQPRSQNRQKAKIRLAAFYARLRNKRGDFLHKLSTDLVKNHDLIVVESLKIGNLLRTSPRSIARGISDAGWGGFLAMLKYKSEHLGKRLVEAGDYFPSTKRCSQCGIRNEITLAERWYRCPCGASLHRDHNAAFNLQAVGATVLKACGAAL